jgi:hypothetical protein
MTISDIFPSSLTIHNFFLKECEGGEVGFNKKYYNNRLRSLFPPKNTPSTHAHLQNKGNAVSALVCHVLSPRRRGEEGGFVGKQGGRCEGARRERN